MWVQSLGWEDPLEKERATLSSILAWEIPWAEEPDLQCSAFFVVQLSHPYMTTGKTIALTRQTFVSKGITLPVLSTTHIL